MTKTIKKSANYLPVIGMFAVSVATVLAGPAVGAQYNAQNGANSAQPDGTPATLFGGDGSIFNIAVNLLLYVIGAISVIMLIVGGIRYTVSNGASEQITQAKNTIMYAIIGLVVAFLAYAIVNWLLASLGQAE